MFASIMVVLGAIVLCLFFLNGGGYVTRDLDVVATVSLPKDWAERAPERHPSLVAFPFVKTEFRWWGAGDPHEVEAWVVIGAPNCSTAEIEAGMVRAFQAMQSRTQRFPEFGSYKYGDGEKWISEGRYQINSLHDPQKVTFLRSVDRAKKWRLWPVYTRRRSRTKSYRRFKLSFTGRFSSRTSGIPTSPRSAIGRPSPPDGRKPKSPMQTAFWRRMEQGPWVRWANRRKGTDGSWSAGTTIW